MGATGTQRISKRQHNLGEVDLQQRKAEQSCEEPLASASWKIYGFALSSSLLFLCRPLVQIKSAISAEVGEERSNLTEEINNKKTFLHI